MSKPFVCLEMWLLLLMLMLLGGETIHQDMVSLIYTPKPTYSSCSYPTNHRKLRTYATEYRTTFAQASQHAYRVSGHTTDHHQSVNISSWPALPHSTPAKRVWGKEQDGIPYWAVDAEIHFQGYAAGVRVGTVYIHTIHHPSPLTH
jgi:hypothetical protein